jgi:hypothetical protein
MNPGQSAEITDLLKAWAGGVQLALERLTPLVYAELRRMAGRYMAKERPENSMQATAQWMQLGPAGRRSVAAQD